MRRNIGPAAAGPAGPAATALCCFYFHLAGNSNLFYLKAERNHYHAA